MKIKVVTIDFWNTLVDSTDGRIRNQHRQNTIVSAAKSLGGVITPEILAKAMQAASEFFNNNWIKEQRTPMPEETVEFFWKHLNIPFDREAMEHVLHEFSTAVLKFPPHLIAGVKESLELLSAKYKLGIVSDTGFSPGVILQEVLRKADVLDYFSAFSFSDETGVSKPHPKAYTTILDAFDCLPGEAVHIGDIERTDIFGAKSLGMKVIKFSGDPTAIFSADNPLDTKADCETMDWLEIPALIAGF